MLAWWMKPRVVLDGFTLANSLVALLLVGSLGQCRGCSRDVDSLNPMAIYGYALLLPVHVY